MAPTRNAAPPGRRLFLQFALSGLLAMLVVALLATIVLRRAGESESVRDARRLTEVLGRSVVEPNLDDGVVRGNRVQLATFDRLVHQRVLRSPVVRVKVWDATGRIVYSDEPRLVGSRYPLGDDELATLKGAGVDAGISDLSAPENRYERPNRKLLEVYMPVHTPSGRPLLFETYLSFSDVAASGRKVWLTFLPALVVALLMLWLLQLPIALSLARRLRRAHAEREALLLRALNASDTERRVIAADLHDGVVQDLAGTSYALAVAAENVDVTPTNEVARALRSGADATRQSMRQLRSLLVEIYPPNLRDAGLEPALNDLAARAVARGVAVDVDVADGLRPSDAVERLVFRTAQEALRNVVEHAGAETCSIEVDANGRGVVLVVADNGRGFERAVLDDRRAQGHLGLALLADQAADLGGSLDIDSTPGAGTRVTLTVPER
ncbi:MAG: sensor histidine kinase [Gaiellaceae bacterium]